MRLIDADELMKDRVENDPVVIAAKCAQTAYDVDKVVEQLNDTREIFESRNIVPCINMDRAIEIVKGCGLNGARSQKIGGKNEDRKGT